MTLTSPKTPSLRTSVLKAVFSIRTIAIDRLFCSDVYAGNVPSRVKACVIGSVISFKPAVNTDGECTYLRWVCGQSWIVWLKPGQWLRKTFSVMCCGRWTGLGSHSNNKLVTIMKFIPTLLGHKRRSAQVLRMETYIWLPQQDHFYCMFGLGMNLDRTTRSVTTRCASSPKPSAKVLTPFLLDASSSSREIIFSQSVPTHKYTI